MIMDDVRIRDVGTAQVCTSLWMEEMKFLKSTEGTSYLYEVESSCDGEEEVSPNPHVVFVENSGGEVVSPIQGRYKNDGEINCSDNLTTWRFMMEGVKGRRVMVAVDESEHSMYSLKWVVENLRPTGSDTLILCHVKRRPVTYGGAAGPGFVLTPEVIMYLEKYEDRNAKSIMKKSREICSGSQVKVEEKIVSGDARESLCEAAKKSETDMLVVGSHGYGPIKRALLGSVSDYCAHHAKCPVLIVKKPHH
ncbi:hypothetical protein KI387_022327 [Taxus chinensis]|uniref:UspA domain-containing protein n=1 Tax=Taxus chinensis TaxID=29808 RepID=A0AA38L9W2_TAXCH|nr:hypothetical protein KI387_022327 [Taxus chinensis]